MYVHFDGGGVVAIFFERMATQDEELSGFDVQAPLLARVRQLVSLVLELARLLAVDFRFHKTATTKKIIKRLRLRKWTSDISRF